MRPSGTVIVVIGNNILQGIEFQTDKLFAEIAEQEGFEIVALHEVRKKRTGNSIVNSSVRRGTVKQRTRLYETALNYGYRELGRRRIKKLDYLLSRLRSVQLCCPGTPWVHDVPSRTAHITASSPRRMIAEAINHSIPDWSKMIEEKSFCQSDPHRHDDQMTNPKLVQGEILRLFNRFGVVTQASI